MTREDIEQINVVEPYCFESDTEELWYNIGLKNGLEIADEHPKSPWISVKEDLPCNHQELIVKPRLTTQVLVYPKKGRYAYFDSMILNIDGWEWMLGEVKYWMPVPDLPKE